MRRTRFVALFTAVTAVPAVGGGLVSVGVVTATSPPTSEPAPPELSAEEEAAFTVEVDFANCMRDHGIEGLPEPQVTDGGFVLIGLPLVPSDDWNGAQDACQHIFDDAASPDETGATGGWENVVPGGDCMCADGSEFAFWERRASAAKVVLFLDGGGTCTSAADCAFTGLGTGGEAAYDWSIYGEDPAAEAGIFDFARPDNPFRDHSFIYVPSCTGDAQLGDVTREYAPDLTVEHNGFVNGAAALSYVAENYQDASQVVIVGKSDGSIAAPVYGGLIADLLPDAQVTVLGGQSGHVPDDPDINEEILGELWGAYDTMPDWEVNRGVTARDWGPPRFWIQAGLHDPTIVLARFDYAYDAEAAKSAESLGLDPAGLLAVIDANEAAIEDAGVVVHSFTAPGDDHGIFEWDSFYEVEVDGVRFVEWVDALLAGEPVEDVHCEQCEPA
jgi:Pectinacetylesterase